MDNTRITVRNRIIPAEIACFGTVVVLLFVFSLICLAQTPLQQFDGTPESEAPITQSEVGLVRLNITMGGGEPCSWNGLISVSDGYLAGVVPLGSESDVPGTFYTENGSVIIDNKEPKRSYGLQFEVFAPLSARLRIRLNGETLGEQFDQNISVQEIINTPYNTQIDKFKNRLILQRSGGDEIAVVPQRDSLVYSPGEIALFEVFPRFLSVNYDKSQSLGITVFRARTEEKIADSEQTISLTRDAQGKFRIPISIHMPQESGVYDIVLSITQPKKQEYRMIPAFGGTKEDPDQKLCERTVQCVVVESDPDRYASLRESGGDITQIKKELVAIIDPSDPDWTKSFAKLYAQITQQSPVKSKESKASILKPRWSGIRGLTGRNWTIGKTQPVQETKNGGIEKTVNGKLNTYANLALELFENGSLGSGNMTIIDTKFGPFAKFPAREKKSDIPWELFAIPVKHPNQPHILEIEYISNSQQTLGISIIEPAVFGGTLPTTIDGGFDVVDEIVSEKQPERISTHRILFWPKTDSPFILLSNQHPTKSAMFGKIRIQKVVSEFPKVFQDQPNRLFAGYIHRPVFADNFSANRIPSGFGNVGNTDWITFYEGTTRLVDYLDAAGYGGAMISVAAEGSSIYPSSLISPTPKYDSGVFLYEGEDPVRKDVVELIARSFDHRRLVFIPAIDFCSPIPRLEERIRFENRNDHNKNGIGVNPGEHGFRWIDAQGRTITQAHETKGGRAPHYNLLNPAVQEEMLNQVHELATRYAKHQSFGGIAIQLSPDGFAQLPQEDWGMDDHTISMFRKETQIAVPGGNGPDRFSVRFEYIRDNCLEEWVRWRVKKVADFYRTMCKLVTEIRPDAKLFLAGADMLEGSRIQESFYPSFNKNADSISTLYSSFLILGFDLQQIAKENGIVFLRPEIIASSGQYAKLAPQWEMEQSDFHTVFPRFFSSPAALFSNSNEGIEIPALAKNSPLIPPMYKFNYQIVPSEYQNRKRFIRQLAKADYSMFFDGGRFLNFGQEEMLTEIIAAFRRLPSVQFKTFTPSPNTPNTSIQTVVGPASTPMPSTVGPQSPSIQPLTVRFAQTEQGTFVYVLNDAPFHTDAKIINSAAAGSRITELSGRRKIAAAPIQGNRLTWSITLEPYDLIAVRIDDPQSVPVLVTVQRPEEICGTKGTLTQKIDLLINASRMSFEYPVLENPGFEPDDTISRNNTSDAFDTINGWSKIGDDTLTLTQDSKIRHQGKASLKMICSGPSGGIVSNTFDAPHTGRIFVSFWLGVEENTSQLPLRIALTGRLHDSSFLRMYSIGQIVMQKLEETPAVNGIRWRLIRVPFTSLPLGALDRLAIRLDMTGAGTVWIDDMRVDSLVLTESERTEFMKVLYTAGVRQAGDRISDSVAILESFWPRILLEKASPAEGAIELSQNTTVVKAQPNPQTASDRSQKPTPQPQYPKREAPTPPKPEPSPNLMNRMKSWWSK